MSNKLYYESNNNHSCGFPKVLQHDDVTIVSSQAYSRSSYKQRSNATMVPENIDKLMKSWVHFQRIIKYKGEKNNLQRIYLAL